MTNREIVDKIINSIIKLIKSTQTKIESLKQVLTGTMREKDNSFMNLNYLIIKKQAIKQHQSHE